MTRREVREHTFRALFQKEFYNSEEYPEQYQRYLENPVFSEDTDAAAQMDDATREYLTGRVASIAEKLPELDEKIQRGCPRMEDESYGQGRGKPSSSCYLRDSVRSRRFLRRLRSMKP